MPNTNKTVKVTNGKIINYTISAQNYKTIRGSQLITADSTISKNMVEESDTNGVYSLGDRIGGIASFVCYFNATDPETNVNKKYAVFVLDAKYRKGSYTMCDTAVIGTPVYNSITVVNNKVTNVVTSATYSTDYVINHYNPDGNFPFQPYYFARAAATLPSLNIQSQLPNVAELKEIWNNREFLDSIDPTLQEYPQNSLVSWRINGNANYRVWSSTEGYDTVSYVTNPTWGVSSSGNVVAIYKNYPSHNSGGYNGVIPVFEIEIE